MADAARVGDPSNHFGAITDTTAGKVRIGGQPAAVVGSGHACGLPSNPPHPPTKILPPGSTKVRIQGMPAARVGDKTACGGAVAIGCPTVHIGG
jgi:uncharacterized Zn-binding protein involved in type VI secretion